MSGLLKRQLTKREMTIVDGLLEGKRNKQIAYENNISENTVKVYFSRLYVKFGITDGRMECARVMRNHRAALRALYGAPLDVGPEVEPEQSPFDRFLLMARYLKLTADQARQVLVVLMGAETLNENS